MDNFLVQRDSRSIACPCAPAYPGTPPPYLPISLRLSPCTVGAHRMTTVKATGQAARKAWRQRSMKSGCRPILSQVTQALISRLITNDISRENTKRRRKASDMVFFLVWLRRLQRKDLR